MSHLFDRLLTTYSKVSDALTFNAATLSGAIDIIVIRHSDGTFTSTPVHVRFGKLQLLKSREKLVTVRVNGRECAWKMKLGHAGEAFFVMDADRQQPATDEELSSPITSPLLSPAATLSTAQGTITPVQPAPHAGAKADSGQPKTLLPHEEYRFPELDLSTQTLSPRLLSTPRAAAAGRVLDVADSAGHLRSASDASAGSSLGRSAAVKLNLTRRFKEDDDERAVSAQSEEAKDGDGDAEGIDADMLWTLQHDSKEDIGGGVRLTRQCFSAPLSPHSPRSPRSPVYSSSVLSPRSNPFPDASMGEVGGLPPSHALRSAASMEPGLSPAPSSPRSPGTPSFGGGDDDRILSAPSASDALEHVYTWTWGHLPVHHQRFHPNEQNRTEQIVHPPALVTSSPALSAAATPPRAVALARPPSPQPSAVALSAAVSTSSIELKGDVVKELQHEAAAAAASLQQLNSASAAAVDSRSWSVRGIFSSVFSKLPARSSFSVPYASNAEPTPAATGAPATAGPAPESKDEPAADTETASALSTASSATAALPEGASSAPPPLVKTSSAPAGSINLEEAHLPVPWLNGTMDSDATSTSASPALSSALAPASCDPPTLMSSPAAAPAISIMSRLPSPKGSDVLTSPLSAPLPSSSVASFTLPSLARPASAMGGSMLQMTRAIDPVPPPAGEPSAEVDPKRASIGSLLFSSPSSSPSVDPSLLRLSLCGDFLGSNAELNRSLFERHAISEAQFASQPELTFRSDLVVLYQQRLYPSRIALPLLLSHLAFGRPLAIAHDGLERLSNMPLPHPALLDPAHPAVQGEAAGAEKGKTPGPGAVVGAQGPASPELGGRSWRDWFRYRKPPPIDTAPAADMASRAEPAISLSATQPLTAESIEAALAARAPLTHSKSLEPMPPSIVASDDNAEATTTASPHPTIAVTVSAPQQQQQPQLASPASNIASAGSAPSPSASSAPSPSGGGAGPSPSARSTSPTKAVSFIKSLRPTSSMLQSLGLHDGRNSITFSVSSALQGQQTVSASIYLWTPDVKIVISDIDGTITRSDILGHVMPLVGRDWSHVGVTQLYSDIHRNGYQLLYLTSRAIGQANITRGYIHSLRQGESSLPFGPVIMSPDRLLHSFKREVIHRRPQEFKIIALRDVAGLFDDDHNPFYAGFGNRITDVVAYRAVGVPASRIFIINHHGTIQHINVHYSKSYPELGGLVHAMFPSVLDGRKGVEEYNDHNYWRETLPALSEDEASDESDDDAVPAHRSAHAVRAGEKHDTSTQPSATSAGEQERKEMQAEADVISPSRPKVIGTV